MSGDMFCSQISTGYCHLTEFLMDDTWKLRKRCSLSIFNSLYQHWRVNHILKGEPRSLTNPKTEYHQDETYKTSYGFWDWHEFVVLERRLLNPFRSLYNVFLWYIQKGNYEHFKISGNFYSQGNRFCVNIQYLQCWTLAIWTSTISPGMPDASFCAKYPLMADCSCHTNAWSWWFALVASEDGP